MLGADLPYQMKSPLPSGHSLADLAHSRTVMTRDGDNTLNGYNLRKIRRQPQYSKEDSGQLLFCWEGQL